MTQIGSTKVEMALLRRKMELLGAPRQFHRRGTYVSPAKRATWNAAAARAHADNPGTRMGPKKNKRQPGRRARNRVARMKGN